MAGDIVAGYFKRVLVVIPASIGSHEVLRGAVSICTTSAKPRHLDKINKIYKMFFVFNLVNLVNPVKKFRNWQGPRPEL